MNKKFGKIILLVTICFSFFFQTKASEKSLYIFFNPNDCLTCSMGLRALSTISQNVSEAIVVRKENGLSITEVLKQYKIPKRCKIIVSDSLFDAFKINQTPSCCVFKIGENKIYTILLKDLFNHVNDINTLSINYKTAAQELAIKNISLSNRLKIYSGGNKYVILDYAMQKLLICNLKDQEKSKSLKYKLFTPSDVNPEKILSKSAINTSIYKQYLPVLKKYGFDKIRIESVSFRNDTTFLAFTIWYASRDRKDTAIKPVCFIGRISGKKNAQSFYVKYQELESKTHYEYNNTLPFFTPDSKNYILGVYPNAQDSTFKYNKTLSSWSINDSNQLSYNELLQYEFPDSVIRNKIPNDYGINGHLLFYHHYPYLIDFKSKVSLNLSNIFKIFEQKNNFYGIGKNNFYLQDAVETGSMLELFYFINDEWKIIYYDTQTEKIIFVNTLPKNDLIDINTYKLINGNTLSALSKDHKTIYFYR